MTVSFSLALRPVCACSGSISECGTLRLAAYPSAYSDDLSAPPFPPPPLPRTPQAMFTASYTPRYARIQHFLAPFSPKIHLADRRTKLCASLLHHFTCHDDVSAWFCLPRVSERMDETPAEPIQCHGSRAHNAFCWSCVAFCLAAVLFRFMSPRLVLRFHSSRTISLRFG